ncbi:acyl-CoA thioesterase [Ammoniphilus sp. 3BR4]|uniref:acyl-CoA thioesterase n=1 Tax=Ammoniphilus sp. 3BR4 TaxID=3158265 RepID=UPI003465F97F
MVQSIYEYKVKWGDTDAAGIVFYPNFYKLMDQATAELFHALGFSLSQIYAKEKIAMPILETHCVFKSPAFFEDSLQVITKVLELREKVYKLGHEFYRGETLLANGYEIRAWTSFGQGKPKAESIPETIREALSSSNLVSPNTRYPMLQETEG